MILMPRPGSGPRQITPSAAIRSCSAGSATCSTEIAPRTAAPGRSVPDLAMTPATCPLEGMERPVPEAGSSTEIHG